MENHFENMEEKQEEQIHTTDNSDIIQEEICMYMMQHLFNIPENIEKKTQVNSKNRTDNSINLDNEKINVKHFDILKYLGGGAFGKVYLVKKNKGCDSGRLYAMKMVQKTNVRKKKSIKQNIVERKVLETIRGCPFLMTMYYAFHNNDKLFLILEYIPGSDLAKQMKYQNRKTFSENEARFYIAEVIVGLQYLHKFNIIHRDIKLQNILLDEKGHVILTDFGCSKKFLQKTRGTMRTHTFCGTFEYMAPEIIQHQNHGYSFSVDWWAVGILTYRLIRGRLPFGNRNSMSRLDIKRQILHSRPRFGTNLSLEVCDFVSRLLTKNPDQRLGNEPYDALELKEHPFFKKAPKDFTWDALEKKLIQPPFAPIKQHEEDITEVFDYADISRTITSSDNLNIHFKNYSYVAPSVISEKLIKSKCLPTTEEQ